MAAGGFDARFVDRLSDRHTCPVCLLALREPTITKCGHLFCNDCWRSLARRGRIECPVCREEQNESEIFPNNYDKREIMSLKIYCDQQEKGCGWKGELRKRGTHNNTCGYVDVLCKHGCGKMVMKKDMESHMKKTCMNRKVECRYCKTTVTFKYLNDHHTKCEMFPVACEYCKQQVVRGEMNEHVSKDGTCPNSPLECEFIEAGCQFIGNRNEMTIHVQNDVTSHLSLLMKQQSNTKSSLSATESSLSATQSSLAATKSLLSSTRACLAKRECELEFITKKVGIQGPFSQLDVCVFEWNITNWLDCMKKAELKPIYTMESKRFYTGPQGYRLYLVLFPMGYGRFERSHVSVDACVDDGDYDDQLPKKQHCKFSFTLIDQQPDAINVVVRREKTIELIPCKYFDATDDFITHETLNSRSYIQNNEIVIQFCLQLNVP
ncbi:TNF receptor-associated factor 6-B-like [Corticium candelabrum]|uniref:TNF receptor-associated factor 6-B-like n=1 Tax=Corticium candelabrum TaxID=121492 RepID=UPI002E2692F1|nr:TNF receptor-associated factor 6-B-like [Corticium candelabrum]